MGQTSSLGWIGILAASMTNPMIGIGRIYPSSPFSKPMPQGLGSSGPTDRATDDQRVYQRVCRDVLQVCRDAGIVSNFSALT